LSGPGVSHRRGAAAISPLTLPTAIITSAPPNRLPPSRRSTASPLPVEAPAGAIARPRAPPASVTSASTVGRPRESQTRRPRTEMISVVLMHEPVGPMHREGGGGYPLGLQYIGAQNPAPGSSRALP